MLQSKQAYCCPACGGYIGDAAPVEFVSDKLPRGHQERIFGILSRRIGRQVSKDTLIDAMYSERADGGPVYADNIVSIEINKLRSQIEGFGWTIVSKGRGSGNKAVYRLIPLEAGAC